MCMFLCRYCASVSALMSVGSRALPIINPQSQSSPFGAAMNLGRAARTKERLLLWTHAAHTADTTATAHMQTKPITHAILSQSCSANIKTVTCRLISKVHGSAAKQPQTVTMTTTVGLHSSCHYHAHIE